MEMRTADAADSAAIGSHLSKYRQSALFVQTLIAAIGK
jgi:hypothetical protein